MLRREADGMIFEMHFPMKSPKQIRKGLEHDSQPVYI